MRYWLKGEVLAALVDYWTGQLQGAVPVELPTDRPRTKAINDRGALYTFKLSVQLTQALKALSRREGVTLFMTLLTAFHILLYPDIPIEMLEMLSEEEKEQQLREDKRYEQTQRHTLKAAKRRVVTPSPDN